MLLKNYFSALSCSALLLFCLFSGNVFGQQKRIGLQVSGGSSSVIAPVLEFEGTSVDLTERISSFGISAILERTYLANKMGVTIEPELLKTGFSLQNNSGIAPITIKNEFYYVATSVSAFFQPLKSDRLRFIVGVTPAYRFKYNQNGTKAPSIIEELYNEADILGFIGCQFRVYKKLSLGFKAARGFTPLTSITYTNDQGQPFRTDDWFNTNMHLYARYYLSN